MSLIATASTWTNDDNNSKKRTSTMRRTIKLKPVNNSVLESDDYTSQSENYQNSEPSSFESNQNTVQDRNNRVNDLLNKITSVNNEEDGNMGNFKPLPNPNINVKKDIDDNTEPPKYSVPKISYLNAVTQQKNANYSANDTPVGNLSNYKMSYEKPMQFAAKPYYTAANMGATLGNDKVMEKINYMIHLLEEQQLEKTNNITEEFILYTFLGVFVIFVVDSFARSGKYIR
jgi:hypothetical protein